MIEVFTMALHQSNIIINILLVSAFILNLVLHSLLSSWRDVQQILFGRGYWF